MANELKELENQTFGSWRILTLVDSGGMGAIFHGQHVGLGARVAIKVLLSGLDARPDVVVRFLNEAKIGANVLHPNIARTLDLFRDDRGRSFIVMEWLDGESLARRLLRSPCSLPEALHVFESTCRGLAAAHRANVVHRDVKPGNIFLSRSEGEVVPKLIDFGIARLAASSNHTRTGLVMGSPPYMSPEQWKGAKYVTVQSDIFAIAVVFYEMLTGHNPFEAESLPEVSMKISTQVLPPHPSVSSKLYAVLLAATARDIGQRLDSVDELLRQVRAATDDTTRSAAPPITVGPPWSTTPLPPSAEERPIVAPTFDATLARGPLPLALVPNYAPAVLHDEHALGGPTIDPTSASLGLYGKVAVPLTLAVALTTALADLGTRYVDWTAGRPVSSLLMPAIGGALCLGFGAQWLSRHETDPERGPRATAAALLSLLACWTVLLVVGEAWTAFYASLSGMHWKRETLRKELFNLAIGRGPLWIAGLALGGLLAWLRSPGAELEDEQDAAAPQSSGDEASS